MVSETRLFYRDATGAERMLCLPAQGFSQRDGITISQLMESIQGGEMVFVTVQNRGRTPARLKWVSFEVDTGFEVASPARFFKHGYQSWSVSYPVVIGHYATKSPRSRIARISHQSEADRPTIAPEEATSELFTVIDSDSSQERLLCGFIGAANQFSTITVNSPAHVTARALLDDTWLYPGEMINVEPLFCWRSRQESARMAARWAELLGRRMNARTTAPYQRGWCSWYQYFDAISETLLCSNLRKLRDFHRELPLEIVQLDDGFQAALGDWERTNAKFPSGLAKIADKIRRQGLTPGLWTAPFLATADSELMRTHPDWFIHDENGEPLGVVRNPAWTGEEGKYACALDPSNPQFRQYLERLFDRLVHEFGYSYLKIDFLFAGTAEGRRYDLRLTRAQALRQGLEAIRRGAGDNTFILACGCPIGPAVGIVDGMRIGPDVAPYWGDDTEPGARLAIGAIFARSFMHRRLWLNDPDCLMVRPEQTCLSAEERFSLASAIAISGGMLMLSDDLNLLDEDSCRLYRMVADIGEEIDSLCSSEPVLAKTMMSNSSVWIATAPGRCGRWYLLLNAGETVQRLSTADFLAAGERARLICRGGERDASDELELQPHSACLIRSLS
jgi:alpha-galactosidase